VLAIWTQPARAETRVVTGGESQLEVHVLNFVKMVGAGMWVYPIEPAVIQYGAQPRAIFPIRDVGAIDPAGPLGAVSNDGGLSMRKQTIGMTLDLTNITATCAVLTGCRLIGTANQALPNEVAELHDLTITDNGTGTVVLQGRAMLSEATALALNTLFQTDIFTAGFELGTWRSSIEYNPPGPRYPRPLAAERAQVSLVPAYQACTAPNRQHGPPLAGASCNPPAPESPTVTVGTGSTARAKLAVLSGDPATLADDADVRVSVSATDVVDAGTAADHTGAVTARVGLRITDRGSGALPVGGSEQATVSDLSLAALLAVR
jgi:hypothetical protein